MADQTVTTTNVLGYPTDTIQKYSESTMGRAAELAGKNYQSYADWAKAHGLTGDQVQAFTDLQTGSFTGAKNLGQEGFSKTAATGIEGLAKKAGETAYNSTEFNNQFQAPQNLGYTANTFQANQMGNVRDVSATGYDAPTMNAAQTGYSPQLQNYQMGPAERVNTQSFAQPGSADAYMSPYMQNVVEAQKREAMRQSGIQGTQQQAQAAQAGAFGGGRDAIMRAERERNLGIQMGDIQATGSQAAYQQAQQQFNAEQQARLQAQQANQQAGLTTGSQNLAANLGVQQLGTQTGVQTALANLSNEQQQQVQNQAAQLQTQGMNAQQAMQAALANQQRDISVGGQNLSAMQQTGLANQSAQNQALQFGAGQGLQSAGMSAQYGLAGQQEAERSKQFGANLGLQGVQAGMQGYGALGSQGQNLYGQNVNNLQLQNAFGTQQQQQGQNMLDVSQQNYAAEQNYPYKQVGFMSDVVNRQPVGNLGSTQTQPGPSIISQGLGAAAAYYGAKKAAGGAIRSYRGAGLVDLALSGM
jgi:hypothetical protein